MTEGEGSRELDPTGLQTLERFAEADRFNEWLFQTIEPYCSGSVLEVGSGIGNLSQFFLKKHRLTVSDLRSEYCQLLAGKFNSHPNLEGVESIDLARPDFAAAYQHLQGRFDTVVALNVVEHISNDHQAVNNCRFLLKTGGRLVILVPAFGLLYNHFDRELGHFRRYNRRSLQALFRSQGFAVDRCWYFNAVGILGWALNGWLLRKRIVPRKQLRIFNRLVPLIRLADRISLYRIGLSVIAAGNKNQ